MLPVERRWMFILYTSSKCTTSVPEFHACWPNAGNAVATLAFHAGGQPHQSAFSVLQWHLSCSLHVFFLASLHVSVMYIQTCAGYTILPTIIEWAYNYFNSPESHDPTLPIVCLTHSYRSNGVQFIEYLSHTCSCSCTNSIRQYLNDIVHDVHMCIMNVQIKDSSKQLWSTINHRKTIQSAVTFSHTTTQQKYEKYPPCFLCIVSSLKLLFKTSKSSEMSHFCLIK